MVLYHVVTTYHLLNAVVHRLHNYEKEDSVIIITKWIVDKFPNYSNLKEFFKDVIVIDDSINITNMTYPEKNTIYCEQLLSEYEYHITDFEEIHMFSPHYKFGVYATHLNIPYIYWEEAAGMISRKQELLKNEYNLNSDDKPAYCDLNGLYDGTAPCVIKRMCNKKVQAEDFDDTNTEHFDVVEKYLALSKELKRKVKAFFVNINEIKVPENSVMLLTQHFANLKLLPFEDHVLIYQMVMDYFFKDKTVVFKPHPDDIMYYGLLFPECQVVREKFPSEFLPVMFTNKPKTIATISSTAIFNLKDYFDESFFLDVRFEKDFKALHRYYTALMLYKKTGMNGTITGIGDNKPMLEELCKAEKITSGCKDGIFYIIDDIETEEGHDRESIVKLTAELPENSAIVFVNSKQDFCFYDIEYKYLWNDIVPVCIKKKQTGKDEFYGDTTTEVVYFYSKNEELRNMAKKLEFNKELKHTGMEISIDKLTPEQKQIRVLEGILEATEKRLLYYMDLVEEMEEKG